MKTVYKLAVAYANKLREQENFQIFLFNAKEHGYTHVVEMAKDGEIADVHMLELN